MAFRNSFCCLFLVKFENSTNQLRMILRRTRKFSDSYGGTETVVWDRCYYQVPSMVGINVSTNYRHKFYNETVQAKEEIVAQRRALCVAILLTWEIW